MSDRGHSDEEGRSSLDDAARRPYRFAGGGAVRIGISDLRGKMLRIEQVLGSRLDPALAERIHELEHQGAVDLLTVPVADVSRHRFRARTQGGTELAIALPRDQRLFDVALPTRLSTIRRSRAASPTLSSSATTRAISIGGCASPAKVFWSPWKRRWTIISPASAH